jgi:hypothetical protein
MSMDVVKAGTATPFQKYKETVTNKKPEPAGKGKVIERGLAWFNTAKKESGTAWESNVDDMDKYQIMLNQQGIHSIHRCYRFEVIEGSLPSKTIMCNTIATKTQWPDANVRLTVGETVDLYAWREGEFVNFGFKKAGEGK